MSGVDRVDRTDQADTQARPYVTAPLLKAQDLGVTFSARTGWLSSRPLHALTGVNFELAADETLGIVGESGCGKSTLARAALHLIMPSTGRVWLAGEDLGELSPPELRRRRGRMQMIFQDPLASLNPRMTAAENAAEPLRASTPELSARERDERALAMLARTGLSRAAAGRYPHEFSGGQAQRIGIARALISAPELLVCDEPVSALDVSVQAQILNLLAELREQRSLATLFISHDLAVVRSQSERVMVLYLGRIMEIGSADSLFRAPLHPYTRGLLSSSPPLDPIAARRWKPRVPVGEPPSPLAPPSGCVFRRRCPHAKPECAARVPPLEDSGDGRRVACLRWREI